MIAHEQDFNSLVNALLPFAQQMLREHGAFLPFGAIANAGRVTLVACDLGKEDATVPELAEFMTVSLRSQAQEHGSVAAAYCVDVRVVDPRSQAKTDAVQLVFEHRSGEAMNVFFPYAKNAAGVYEFDHPFALVSERRIFAGAPNTHLN
jgi:hypothetical protein